MPADVVKLIQALPDKQWSSANAATETSHSRFGTISQLSFLLVFAAWNYSVKDEVGIHHTITQKGRHGFGWSKILRRISNLSVISKLLEWLVSRQLLVYLKESNMLTSRESAYRAHHSTETAVLRVLSEILLTLDSGNIAVLALLYLFDRVDQATLLQRLRTSYGLVGSVITWFTSA